MNLTINAPAETFVQQPEVIDCRASTGLFKLPQPDGSPSFVLNYGDGDSTVLQAGGHAYRQAGTYIIQAIGKSIGGVVTTATKQIVVKDIPRATPENTQVLVDRGKFLNGGALQDALDLAAGRNTVEQEIVVPAGFQAIGPIYMTRPIGDKYITVRSSAIDSLPAGQRVKPGDERLLFWILSVDGKEALTAPSPSNGTHHYCFRGMGLGQLDSTLRVHHLSYLGSPTGPFSLETIAHHLIIDQCWFDGGKNDTDQIRSGASIWASHVSIHNSRFAEFRLIGGGVDAQAFGITLGQQAYSFRNSYLVATSENVNLCAGGAADVQQALISNPTRTSCTLSHVKNLELDQNIALPVAGAYHAKQSTIVRSINGNNITFDEIYTAPDANGTALWQAVPSFIEFRDNHCFKPLKWFPRHPSWNGINYQIKNLWESKFGRYIVNDGNILENSWVGDQAYGIAISPRNGGGGETPASVLREIQWSNTILKNCASGINIASCDYAPDKPSQLLSDVWFINMLFQNVGPNWDSAGASQLITMQSPHGLRMKRVHMLHCTDDNGMPINDFRAITDFGENGGADEATWKNCLHQHGGYGFKNSFTVVDSASTIRRGLPLGDSSNWGGNCVINTGAASYPENTILLNASWPGQFIDYAGGDFTLAPTSPGKSAALNGRDCGVDMVELRWRTRGCVSGVWDETAESMPLPVPSLPVPPELSVPLPISIPPPITVPPAPVPSPVNVSPDGLKASVIIDTQGATWTIGINNETLRDGIWMSRGLGTEYKWLGGAIYTHGTDNNWHRWLGERWEVVMPLGSEPGVPSPEPQPPVPTPQPTPAPTPQPPAPTPCSISAPASISIPRNGSGTIAVTLNNVSGPVDVKVIGSDGQVTVSPLTWSASPSSAVKQFSVRVKKQSRTITFSSPCGSASVKVNVT